MPTSNPASIEVEGLVREFKKGPRAVDGIDLQVAPGEIYGFLGPNGAGKSTTVLMLTTLLPPTAGTARVGGYAGVTVFLTTRYLEEADTLADRVGIIDHGRIVAEGTPAALKQEIGRPSVEAIPVDEADFDAVVGVLERFGERTLASRHGAAVRLGGADLSDIVRALDQQNLKVQHLQLHAPSLNDVFLAKTGRSLEGAGDEESDERARQASEAP